MTQICLFCCAIMQAWTATTYISGQNQRRGPRTPWVWDITVVKKQLGSEICMHILFLHALLGCDNISPPWHRERKVTQDVSVKPTLSWASSGVVSFRWRCYCCGGESIGQCIQRETWKSTWFSALQAILRESGYKHFPRQSTLFATHFGCSTVSVFTYRYSSGKDLGVNSFQWNGGGKRVTEDLCQCTQTCLLLLMSYYG